MDLDEAETGDVDLGGELHAEEECSIYPEPVIFVCWSPIPSHTR